MRLSPAPFGATLRAIRGMQSMTISGRTHPSRRHILQLAAILATRTARADTAITDTLVKAAQSEGTLSYYHNSDIEPTARWTEAFTKKYGVSTKNMRLPSYPLFDRWLNEERVGRHLADLVQITDPTLLSLANKQGFVANYVPAGGAVIPADLKEEGIWYGLFLDSMGIGYNKSKVTPEEEDLLRTGGWNALADPRWKGRFGTATPASGGSSYAFCYMFLVALRDQYGHDFFTKLAANKPDIYASKAPLFERLAAGEYALMDQGSAGSLSDLYLKGAPIRWVYPAPTPVAVTAQIVCRNAPHPNAARLFQEWCTSAEGQAEWLKYTIAGTSRPDVVDPRKAAKSDWYAEPWFHEPTAFYTAYLKDAAFADPKKPVIAEWNEIFNYQGGRK
jgi:ABC-type Fe3+ transport system substrate-binding protein